MVRGCALCFCLLAVLGGGTLVLKRRSYGGTTLASTGGKWEKETWSGLGQPVRVGP
ncbi:hypothetical protein RchiOBHm_Chr5g0051711 [Rosa chinensis]|uniref:Non-specific serine/threonine protein kinase n=1 Tax=Rosa chinensis TaxID=74649 RepID=A0A2P6QFF9_ROSCH|nr:hypothetical protein RchiOBHm_Chr5g0051711 [Rosa chinensis]